MSNQKFAVGEQVKLKSGGPIMTVKSAPDDDEDGIECLYTCQWFTKDRKCEEQKFSAPSLELPDKIELPQVINRKKDFKFGDE